MASQQPMNKYNAVIKTTENVNTLGFDSYKLLLENSIFFIETRDQHAGAWAVGKVQKSQVLITSRLTQAGKVVANSKQQPGVTVRSIKYSDITHLGKDGTTTRVLPAALGTDQCCGWRSGGVRYRLEGPTTDKEDRASIGTMRLLQWDEENKEWDVVEEDFDLDTLLENPELNQAVQPWGEPRVEMVDPLSDEQRVRINDQIHDAFSDFFILSAGNGWLQIIMSALAANDNFTIALAAPAHLLSLAAHIGTAATVVRNNGYYYT